MRRRPVNKTILKRSPVFPDRGEFEVIDIPFGELIATYFALTDNIEKELKYWQADARSKRHVRDTVERWRYKSDFYGGVTDDMKNYVRNGYRTGSVLGEFLPGVLRTHDGSAQRGRWLWSDTGDEIDVGLALSGDVTPFRSFEPSPTAGGLNVQALYSFTADTSHEIIAQYGAWIARLLATATGAGVSPSLTIDQYSRELSDNSQNAIIRTRVKTETEALDWNRYSCIFSPTGYRHLGFTGLMRAGASQDLLDGSMASGLGGCISPPEWDLAWDEPTRTLTVWSPMRPHSFPSQHLTDRLIETGALNPIGAMA